MALLQRVPTPGDGRVAGPIEARGTLSISLTVTDRRNTLRPRVFGSDAVLERRLREVCA